MMIVIGEAGTLPKGIGARRFVTAYIIRPDTILELSICFILNDSRF